MLRTRRLLLLRHLIIAHAYLFVVLKCKEQAIFSVCNFEIIREVAQVVPCSHLLLREGTPNVSLRILIEPFAVVLLARGVSHEEVNTLNEGIVVNRLNYLRRYLCRNRILLLVKNLIHCIQTLLLLNCLQLKNLLLLLALQCAHGWDSLLALGIKALLEYLLIGQSLLDRLILRNAQFCQQILVKLNVFLLLSYVYWLCLLYRLDISLFLWLNAYYCFVLGDQNFGRDAFRNGI